jgi:hypothetical protein
LGPIIRRRLGSVFWVLMVDFDSSDGFTTDPANNAAGPFSSFSAKRSQRTSRVNHRAVICRFVRALTVHSWELSGESLDPAMPGALQSRLIEYEGIDARVQVGGLQGSRSFHRPLLHSGRFRSRSRHSSSGGARRVRHKKESIAVALVILSRLPFGVASSN